MSVVLLVVVLTANWIRPPPFFGILTSVIPNTCSVAWLTFALGKAALIAGIFAPMPTPRAFAPPRTAMSTTSRGLVSV